MLTPIPIFSRHGLSLLSEMVEASRPHAASLVGSAKKGRSS
jgi:hypothetical protein